MSGHATGSSVALSEEECVKVRPGSGTVEWLSQHIGWILLGIDKVESDKACSNGLADTVAGQRAPALGQGGMRKGGASDDALVVTEQP